MKGNRNLSEDVNLKAALKDRVRRGAGGGSAVDGGRGGVCSGSQNNTLCRREILLSLWKEM